MTRVGVTSSPISSFSEKLYVLPILLYNPGPEIADGAAQLPEDFIKAVPNLYKADLLIVMGTSLIVQPFASLAERVPDSCPRVLINLDRVGSFGSKSDDVVLLGKCDEIVRELCKELGWEDELVRLWDETAASVVTDTKPEPKAEPDQELKRPDVLQEIEEQFENLGLGAKVDDASRGASSSQSAEPKETTDKSGEVEAETTSKTLPATTLTPSKETKAEEESPNAKVDSDDTRNASKISTANSKI